MRGEPILLAVLPVPSLAQGPAAMAVPMAVAPGWQGKWLWAVCGWSRDEEDLPRVWEASGCIRGVLLFPGKARI